MAGTLTIGTLSDGTNSTSSTNCIQGSAKAWVEFNGSSPSIRASYNVSSITKPGTGTYQVNFTNSLADGNYSAVVGGTGSNSGSLGCNTALFTSNSPAALTTPSSSSFTFTTWLYNYSTTFDPGYVCASVFR